MDQQFIPHGPARTAERKSSPDRTHILEPKDFWPNVRDCPDWPQVGPNGGFSGQRGKAGAEARLEVLGQHLNRGATSLHVPTADDRTAEFAKTFRRNGTFGSWPALGIYNLMPLGMLAENDAMLMVEACHIRGYLLKLEAATKRDAEAAEQRKQAEARRTLEDYRAKAPEHIAEINSLAEAVARHRQREEDERAVSLDRMHRDQLDTLHSAAVRAAHTLGLSVPDAPQIGA